MNRWGMLNQPLQLFPTFRRMKKTIEDFVLLMLLERILKKKKMYTRIFQFSMLSPCLCYAFPVLCYVFSKRTQYIFTLSKDLELRGCKVLKHCRPCALKCPSSTTPILPLTYNNESLYRPHTQRPDRTPLLSLQAWKKISWNRSLTVSDNNCNTMKLWIISAGCWADISVNLLCLSGTDRVAMKGFWSLPAAERTMVCVGG